MKAYDITTLITELKSWWIADVIFYAELFVDRSMGIDFVGSWNWRSPLTFNIVIALFARSSITQKNSYIYTTRADCGINWIPHANHHNQLSLITAGLFLSILPEFLELLPMLNAT